MKIHLSAAGSCLVVIPGTLSCLSQYALSSAGDIKEACPGGRSTCALLIPWAGGVLCDIN